MFGCSLDGLEGVSRLGGVSPQTLCVWCLPPGGPESVIGLALVSERECVALGFTRVLPLALRDSYLLWQSHRDPHQIGCTTGLR